MIGGVGCDIVDVTRFERWKYFSRKQLETLFSPQELIDCTSIDNILIPEKLATRFAAKEAAYKALSQLLVSLEYTQKTISFRAFCTLVIVSYTTWDIPKLSIEIHTIEHMINQKLPPIALHVSFSHEKTMAMAVVIVEI